MTKKQTEILEALNTREARGRTIKARAYVIKEDGDVEAKIGKTGIVFLGALFATGKTEITEAEFEALVREMEIKTKQDKWKVWQYYRPKLVKAGWIEIKKLDD